MIAVRLVGCRRCLDVVREVVDAGEQMNESGSTCCRSRVDVGGFCFVVR